MERLIGVDESLGNLVVGCDPGPEHCAFAFVSYDGTFQVKGLAYPRWDDLFGVRCPELEAAIPSRGFVFAYEKMTTRYGAVPGATTYDTCRNSGIAVFRMVRDGAIRVFGLGTVDWRVALGGRTNLKDSETRAALIQILGKDADAFITAEAARLKKLHGLDKPIGCHLRDAVGVAIGAYLMKRHGTPASEREVWHV